MKKIRRSVLLFGLMFGILSACGKQGKKSETEVQGTTNAVSEGATEAATEKGTEKAAAEKPEKQVVEGTVSNTIDMTKYEKGKKIRLWVPLPHDSEYQTVDGIEYDAGNTSSVISGDDWGNQMLYVEWDENAEPADRVVNIHFDVKREEVLRPELKEEDTEALPEEVKKYLEPSKNLPLNDQVKAKAMEVIEGKTTDLEKARAIYDWVIANMNRNEDVKGCGEGDVCALLDTTMSGKCTDINSMFVALCRASGIPAREHFGIRINVEDITKNQHCWAEFYLKGTGWVSADPADVLKAVLKNNWTKEQEETKEKQEYYWGNLDAERIILSDGRDLKLNPVQAGEALNDFGYPYAEIDGQKLDNYTPDQFVYSYSFVKKNE